MPCTDPHRHARPDTTSQTPEPGAGGRPVASPARHAAWPNGLDRRQLLGWTGLAAASGAALLAGCGSSPLPPWQPPAGGTPNPPPRGGGQAPTGAAAGGHPPAVAAAPAAPRPARPARDWHEYRERFAQRLVAANPQGTYLGAVVEPLLAIPVLEVELYSDGRVRKIDVKRRPGQALDTVQLAIDAVHRAAPFEPVNHLPRPWQLTEVFLFNDHRRFKPRTLDVD